MPFKAPENPKCPKCTKSVYHAEARVVGDVSFHKECYKCSMCNKMLDSTNANMHENVLYCKTCHGRKFGPKGYGFGGGAAGLSMDTGSHLGDKKREEIKQYKPPMAAPGEGCPRCGGKVFAAEEMLAKGKSYHQSCFNCKACRKPLDSVVHCDGPDNNVYCKVCYGKAFGPKGYGFGSGAGTLTCGYEEVAPIVRSHGNPNAILPCHEGEIPCPRCGGRVFTAELMLAKGRPYHKQCFKCKCCKRPLDSMVHCDGPDNEVYCKLCYAKKYGPKGYGFAGGCGGVLVAENIPGGEDMPGVNPSSVALDVTKIRAEEGKGCPRCGGKVFMAEEINVRQRSFHKRCYNCCYCHRPLDSVTGCDSPDGEVYCKLCYAKKYGPKGYGFAAGGGGVLVAENISGGDDTSKADSKKADTGRLDTALIQAEVGKGCPRCGGKVFMAEEMHARGRSYHKRCYNCNNCHRPLDSMVGCDAPDKEIYCKLCYAKKYGPKGYGFAAGCGGVLVAENIPGGRSDEGNDNKALKGSIDTACIQAAAGEGCPRCGGKVFTAEERLSRNKKWHKRCYTCRECTRPLDSMVLCDGPDGDIYCKLCYAKKYGPKGYGFAAGAGGVLVPENFAGEDDYDYLGLDSADGMPRERTAKAAFTVLDVTKFPAKEGQSRCPRCAGAVFQAEAMPCRGKEWHKRCYNCCECHRPLDSMLACDAPDGEIYCKLCYAKRHGPKGYGYGHTPALVTLGTDDGSPMPTDIRQFGFGGKGPQQVVPSMPHVGGPPSGPRTQGGMPTPLVGSYPPQQRDVSPIVAGVHMDGGSPVSIIAGVSEGHRNDFMPTYPDDQMIVPTASQDPQANIPPEMLADMVAHQSAIEAQNAQVMMASQQRSLIAHNDNYSEVSSHQSESLHQQSRVESVKMQQMSMSSEMSSTSSMSEAQLNSQFAPHPMLDSQPAFDPDFEPQTTTEHDALLPDPGEPMHDDLYQEDDGDFVEPEDPGFSPGTPVREVEVVEEEEEEDASDM